MRSWLFLLNLLALAFEGYPLLTMCFSPHSADNHFCAVCDSQRPYPGTLYTGAIVAQAWDRSRVWEGMGEPKEAMDRSWGNNTASVGHPQAHNVGRPGTNDLPVLAFQMLGLLACTTVPGSTIQRVHLYPILLHGFSLYNCHPHPFPELFHIPK